MVRSINISLFDNVRHKAAHSVINEATILEPIGSGAKPLRMSSYT